MKKWFVLAATCFAFSAAYAQQDDVEVVASEVVSSETAATEEVVKEEVSTPPSLFNCGCKGKSK